MQATVDRIRRLPDAYEPRVLKDTGTRPLYLSDPLWRVALGTLFSGSEIMISQYQVVGSAGNIVEACRLENGG